MAVLRRNSLAGWPGIFEYVASAPVRLDRWPDGRRADSERPSDYRHLQVDGDYRHCDGEMDSGRRLLTLLVTALGPGPTASSTDIVLQFTPCDVYL